MSGLVCTCGAVSRRIDVARRTCLAWFLWNRHLRCFFPVTWQIILIFCEVNHKNRTTWIGPETVLLVFISSSTSHEVYQNGYNTSLNITKIKDANQIKPNLLFWLFWMAVTMFFSFLYIFWDILDIDRTCKNKKMVRKEEKGSLLF